MFALYWRVNMQDFALVTAQKTQALDELGGEERMLRAKHALSQCGGFGSATSLDASHAEDAEWIRWPCAPHLNC
jgi:hypothetical protein